MDAHRPSVDKVRVKLQQVAGRLRRVSERACRGYSAGVVNQNLGGFDSDRARQFRAAWDSGDFSVTTGQS